eukprot:1486335-Pyramimonas_sp.AAC.1
MRGRCAQALASCLRRARDGLGGRTRNKVRGSILRTTEMLRLRERTKTTRNGRNGGRTDTVPGAACAFYVYARIVQAAPWWTTFESEGIPRQRH